MATFVASWINTSDELPNEEMFNRIDGDTVFEAFPELTNTPSYTDFQRRYLDTPKNFTDASSYNSDLAELFRETQGYKDGYDEYIQQEEYYYGRAEFLRNSEGKYGTFGTIRINNILIWNILPAILFLSYLLGVLITRNPSSHYAPVLFLLGTYSTLTIYYAMNGPTDPDTAAHMHLLLIPIFFGIPMPILVLSVNASLLRNRIRKAKAGYTS
jgi:hypothetical protein